MNDKEQIQGINGLKAIAACIVAFAWHYQHFAGNQIAPFKSVLKLSYDYGWIMVELFFILSGFGIMAGYSKRIMHHEIKFSDYILRRIKKIYPLFLMTTILVVILELFYYFKIGETFVYPNFDVYHLILNLLFLQDGLVGVEWSLNSPSWCISICLLCYCIAYVLIYFSKNENEMIYKFIIAACLGVAIIASGLDRPILNSLVGRGVASFSVGALIYELNTRKNKLKYKRIGCLAVVFLIASYIIMRFFSERWIGNVQIAFILGFGPMILVSVLFIPFINKLLSLKPLIFIGSLSLEIYLFHFPVQCFIKNLDLYFNIGIDYNSHIFWLCYVIAVIMIGAIYKYLIKTKYESLLINFFISQKKEKGE